MTWDNQLFTKESLFWVTGWRFHSKASWPPCFWAYGKEVHHTGSISLNKLLTSWWPKSKNGEGKKCWSPEMLFENMLLSPPTRCYLLKIPPLPNNAKVRTMPFTHNYPAVVPPHPNYRRPMLEPQIASYMPLSWLHNFCLYLLVCNMERQWVLASQNGCEK